MEFNSLFLGTLATATTALVSFAPVAQAGELVNWRYDRTQNKLEFVTDAGVQPRAVLLVNQYGRLVIDLPGTRLGRKTDRQNIGTTVRSVRAGQFLGNITRLVVEFAPGYTIDPQQVKITGRAANQWSIQLPRPIPISSLRINNPNPTPPLQKANLQIASNGLFLPLRGQQPKIEVRRSRDRKEIAFYLNGVQLNNLNPQTINRYGISYATFQQVSRSPNITRVIFNVNPDSPDWEASTSYRGVVFSPKGGVIAVRGIPVNPIPTPRSTPPSTSSGNVARRNANGELEFFIPVPRPLRAAVPVRSSPPRIGSRNPSNARVVVMIDPGHGGKDPGAIGIGGLREKDVVLDISGEVTRKLQQSGVAVRLTRDRDYFVSLSGRAQMANRSGADIFVSIHANSVGGRRPQVNGAETFYYSSGYRLAQSIQSSIIRQTGMNNRGVKRARFYVLRYTSMPSALVEVGFVTGNIDSPRLANSSFRKRMGQAIADGIINYIRRY